MKKVKLNFNIHSAGAWTTLIGAGVSAGVGLLTALGVTVDHTQATTITGAAQGIISLLVAFGVLTAPTDKKGDKDE